MRFSFFAAIRSAAKGALKTCSSENAFCAAAHCGNGTGADDTTTANDTAPANTNSVRLFISDSLRPDFVCSVRWLPRLCPFDRNTRAIERPRNFQDMTRLDGTTLAPPIGDGLYGQVGIASKADGALHESKFAARLETQPGQHNTLVTQSEGAFAGRPARFSDAWLAVGNAGADVPAAKLDVPHAHIAATCEAFEQFLAADTLRGEMQSTGRRTAKTFRGVGGSWHLCQIHVIKVSGDIVGR